MFLKINAAGNPAGNLRFVSGLGLRSGDRPVGGAAAIGVITFGRASSLALKDSRMDALAMTALAKLDQSLGTPHNTEAPFF